MTNVWNMKLQPTLSVELVEYGELLKEKGKWYLELLSISKILWCYKLRQQTTTAQAPSLIPKAFLYWQRNWCIGPQLEENGAYAWKFVKKWYRQRIKYVRIELRLLSRKQTKIHLWGTCHLSLVKKAIETFGISCCPWASALSLHYRQYHSHASDEVQLFFPVRKIIGIRIVVE
jgi:hypothetical protein